MKSHFLSKLFILTVLVPIDLQAQPPKPAEGYRWTLNEQYSDEFNGESLDMEKWYNYHPYWQGRPPAKFTPSQVSVKDGNLVLKNKKIEDSQPEDTWTIASAAVISRGETAHFGYYECSQKASKIRMSSTFWMANRGAPGHDPCSRDRYSQELDIQEAVGGATSDFNRAMHSNSHYNYTDCQGVKTNYSAGSKILFEEGQVSDTFHVYAAHWKNALKADFYLDGKYGNGVTFRNDLDDTPFERPMFINMVTETYDWVTPPTDEDLADDSRNTTYIDWVRAWKLVPVDQVTEEDALVQNGGFETGDFSHWTGWGGNPKEVVSQKVHSGDYATHIVGPGAPEYVVNLRSYSSYTLSCYGLVTEGSGPVHFGIKDASEEILGSVQVTENSYTKKIIEFTTGSTGLNLKFYFYALNPDSEGYADDFSLVLNDPSDTVTYEENILDENILFEEHPGVLQASEHIEIPVSYKANGARQIHLQLRNADSILIGSNIYPAMAGYGVKKLIMALDSVPSAGDSYMLIAEIMFKDSLTTDPSRRDILTLDLRDSVSVSVKVLDNKNESPLEGAKVTLNESLSMLTSSEGIATFAKVGAGSLSFRVELTGFEPYESKGIELSRDSLIQIGLNPFTYNVSVVVSDENTSEAIPSAAVSLGEVQTEADLSGIARFQSGAGSFTLKASSLNYHPTQMELVITTDTTIEITLRRSHANVNFVIKQDGNSLHNAVVTVGETSNSTSTIGLASFTNLTTEVTHDYSIVYEEDILAEGSFSMKTDTTIRINIQTIGIPLTKEGEGLQIYPNPSNESIRVSGLKAESLYTIRNVLGATLKQDLAKKDQSIDLSDLSSGIYFITVEGYTPLKLIKTCSE